MSSWDVGISEYGDFVLAGNRDLAGASGTTLLEQRIKIRLRVERGAWIYDETRTLGSMLYTLIGKDPSEAAVAVDGYVREALASMSEIEVVSAQVFYVESDSTLVSVPDQDTRGIAIMVNYKIRAGFPDIAGVGDIPRQVVVTFATVA